PQSQIWMTAFARAGRVAGAAGKHSRLASISPAAPQRPPRTKSRREQGIVTSKRRLRFLELLMRASLGQSVPVEKLRAVDQGPGDIDQHFAAWRPGGAGMLANPVQLLRRR